MTKSTTSTQDHLARRARNRAGSAIYEARDEQLHAARDRDQVSIDAMRRPEVPQNLSGFFTRKPWRSASGPKSLRDVKGWLRHAHDCQSPRNACSCNGGFRFPSQAG